jgi:ABC-type multidrug transport system permease subunit
MDGLCLTFDDSNGVLQPYKHLGWWKWMYRTSPYTYIIEGIVGQGKYFVLWRTCFLY